MKQLIFHAISSFKWLSRASGIESDAKHKYPFFDKNKHFSRLNSCKIRICGDKMESYISRYELASFRS